MAPGEHLPGCFKTMLGTNSLWQLWGVAARVIRKAVSWSPPL